MPATSQAPAGAVFGPAEIAKMTQAFQVALSSMTEDGTLPTHLSSRELRQRVASEIIQAASTGTLEPEMLARMAVRGIAPNGRA